MLKNIQTLRFLAAFWVILHHMSPPVTPFTLSFLPESFTKLGFAGVDIFFVISGFIMAETTRGLPNGLASAARFLIRRFGRIYIGWWPLFIIYYFGAVSKSRLREQVDLWGSFFLWPQDLMLNLLPITWTLSFELYFYLILSMIVAWSRNKALHVLGICSIIVIAFNIWFFQRGLYLPTNEALAKVDLLVPFYLSPLIIEFIAGFFLSELLKRFPRQSLGCWLTGAVITIILTFLYQNSNQLHPSGLAGFFHVVERTVLLGGFASCLVVCGMEMERRNITFGSFFQTLGNASYSIYLSHIICLTFAAGFYYKFEPKLNLSPTGWGLVTIIASLVFSMLYYQWMERPLNLLLKRQLAKLSFLQYSGRRED